MFTNASANFHALIIHAFDCDPYKNPCAQVHLLRDRPNRSSDCASATELVVRPEVDVDALEGVTELKANIQEWPKVSERAQISPVT